MVLYSIFERDVHSFRFHQAKEIFGEANGNASVKWANQTIFHHVHISLQNFKSNRLFAFFSPTFLCRFSHSQSQLFSSEFLVLDFGFFFFFTFWLFFVRMCGALCSFIVRKLFDACSKYQNHNVSVFCFVLFLSHVVVVVVTKHNRNALRKYSNNVQKKNRWILYRIQYIIHIWMLFMYIIVQCTCIHISHLLLSFKRI